MTSMLGEVRLRYLWILVLGALLFISLTLIAVIYKSHEKRVTGSKGTYEEQAQKHFEPPRVNQVENTKDITNLTIANDQTRATLEDINYPDLILPEIELLRQDVIGGKIKIMSNIIEPDVVGFGESSDAVVQACLTEYNSKISLLVKVFYEGQCAWGNNPNNDSGRDHTLEYERDGCIIKQTCGTDKRIIKGNLASINGQTDNAYIDAYYLLPLTCFNPQDFNETEYVDIDVISYETNSFSTVPVLAITSHSKKLYFDQKDDRLLRVDILAGRPRRAIASVEFDNYKEYEGISFPMKIRVHILDKSEFPSPVELREWCVLTIDPESFRAEIIPAKAK